MNGPTAASAIAPVGVLQVIWDVEGTSNLLGALFADRAAIIEEQLPGDAGADHLLPVDGVEVVPLCVTTFVAQTVSVLLQLPGFRLCHRYDLLRGRHLVDCILAGPVVAAVNSDDLPESCVCYT